METAKEKFPLLYNDIIHNLLVKGSTQITQYINSTLNYNTLAIWVIYGKIFPLVAT